MRFKCSATLVFIPGDGVINAYNFLTKSVFQCSRDLLAFLTDMQSWLDLSEIGALLPDFEEGELAETIANLVAVNAVIEEGSVPARNEDAFAGAWDWGLPTALMHFSVQDNAFITVDQAEALQRQKANSVGLINLFQMNGAHALPLPDPLSNKPLISLMAKRRTVRQARPDPITLEQLSDCLFSGLGITGSRMNCVGELPLSMTPSGGARNPFEAYVFARDVRGLPAGVYHYSALQHSLERVAEFDADVITALIGGQEWGDDKPCLILLCAMLERTMWKYEDPNAYRVVLIEAGHIGQNIMLTATGYGLTACPTAAIDHARAKAILGLEHITQAPIYALTLSVPATELTVPDRFPLAAFVAELAPASH